MTVSPPTSDRILSWLRELWERGWVKGLLLVVAVVFAYQPAWHAGFIWDDDAYVTDNPLLTAPDGLRRIWFSLDSPSQYFPLTYTTFRLERSFWGLNPTGYHLMNILLHAVNALLVWRLLRRLSVPGAWLAAALFALHPVQVESVAWITEWKNVLSLFFFLLAVLAWIEFTADRPRPSWRWYGLTLLFYLLSLSAKTTACTLPAALLLVLWLQGKSINLSRLVQVVPFIALGLAMGLVTMWWERHHQGTQGESFGLGWRERLLLATHGVWFYAGKLLWPANLTFSYPRWTINSADPLAYGWLLGGGAVCAAIYCARRIVGRSVEVAVAFYVATLSPLLGFIMLATFRYSFVADHYQYAASIGLLALAAAGITAALGPFRKGKPFLEQVLCGMLLLALGGLTWRQAAVYRDSHAVWLDTLAKNPDSWLAHNNLGILLSNQGHIEKALEHYHQAAQIHPISFEVQNNLGLALTAKGRFDEAIKNFRKAIEINPHFSGALNNLGVALTAKGQFDGAIENFRKAIEINPNFSGALNNLAWALATSPNDKLRNGAEAVGLAEHACELTHFQQPLFIGTLAAAYAECGRFPEAVTTAEKAERLATAAGLKAVAAKNQQLLELYRVDKPYHEPVAMRH